MTTRLALPAQRAPIRQLFDRGRHVYRTCGDEDLPELLEQGLVVVGEEGTHLWGVLCLQLERRPPTLPEGAPDRAYLRGLALAAGRSPSRDVVALMEAALVHLHTMGIPRQVIGLAGERWLSQPLGDAGFEQVDRVGFFVRTRRDEPTVERPARLRPAAPADLGGLAKLDAQAFIPLWHMGQSELAELFFACRMQVAEWAGQMAGYSAVTLPGRSPEPVAHLVRVAVHPAAQGNGIGRQLVADCIGYALRAGASRLQLNTQTSNRRSQRLYTALGFRPAGRPLPVLVKTVADPRTEVAHG